jgi:hypothetical protein
MPAIPNATFHHSHMLVLQSYIVIENRSSKTTFAHPPEKGKIGEVLCRSACYPSGKALFDALSDQVNRAVSLMHARETSDR